MTKLENIPEELKRHAGWLGWKFTQKDKNKKPLKMPHYLKSGKWRAGHAHGSREDRQQLVDFTKAEEIYRGSGKKYTGLGFAMLADWNCTAADFDDCIDAEGVIHPQVLDLVGPTYWEISPSGKGIRAFFSGPLRDVKLITQRAKKKGLDFGVEFFCSKGFVTVTGNVTEANEIIGQQIVPITPELRAFFEEHFGGRDVSTRNSDQPVVGMTDGEIVKMLELWDPDCDYDTWLKIGMAIHHETDGAGFELWHDWSANGASYESHEDCQYKWESFGRGDRKSVKTIRWMIHEKPLDFALENVGNDFAPLPKKVDADGNVRRPMPRLFGIDGKGEVPTSASNVSVILKRTDISGFEFRDDVFVSQTMIQPYGADDEWRRVRETDYVVVQQRLEALNFKNPSMEKVRNGVALEAYDNEFDSAIHWLEEIVPKWDGVPRVADFTERYMGCTEDPAYARAVSMYAWTAQAGRVLQPGVKADMMPVFMGKQGIGKSSTIKAIAPDEDFFVDISFLDEPKVNIEKTISKLVVECAELDGLSKRDNSSVRAYVSRSTENYRFPYSRDIKVLHRRFMLWGTTNDDTFLTDPTGNRRFLPLHTNAVSEDNYYCNVAEEERLQHWAEARELFKKNGIMCADEANKLAEPYRRRAMVIDPWRDTVEDALLHTKDEVGVLYADMPFISNRDIWISLLGMTDSNMHSGHAKRLGAVMMCIGYERHKGTKGIRGWRKTCNENADCE